MQVNGDKSIAQRVLMLAAIAEGESFIKGDLQGGDILSTCRVLRQLGAEISWREGGIKVKGWGARGPLPCVEPLDCGNSATCMRTLVGLLAFSGHTYTLTGDASLLTRPMERVADTLGQIGVKVVCSEKGTAPLVVYGQDHPSFSEVEVVLNVASAQLKTSLMWALLLCPGISIKIIEPLLSRDHSEILARHLQAKVIEEVDFFHRHIIKFSGISNLTGFVYDVKGDSSSAAFLVTLAILKEGKNVFIENVSLNPTRLGFYHVLQRMGAKISLDVKGQSWGESFGTITTEYSRLRATDVLPKEVPLCVDELPLLALVASQAEGVTRVHGARELRFKESDRLSCTLRELGKLGVKSCEYADGFAIEGPCKLKGGYLQSYGDHRLSMTWGVASALSDCSIDIEGKDCCEVSFPRFWEWII